MEETLLNSKQLAQKLNVSERAVRDWVFKCKVEGIMVRAGRLVRFDPKKVDDRIKDGRIFD